VLTTVTSHAIDLPACHGISVLPSGRLPSSLTNPDGSLMDGTLALHRARQTRSLTYYYFFFTFTLNYYYGYYCDVSGERWPLYNVCSQLYQLVVVRVRWSDCDRGRPPAGWKLRSVRPILQVHTKQLIGYKIIIKLRGRGFDTWMPYFASLLWCNVM